ncbi:uncharacterized protein LOC103867440 isoform X2 [Brassica rapa]|uniref:uncharacterized protein LOC103867440 isoform X2 n=1 Tax=Brassica campestris TaxID=3711 RepID=UPI00142E87A3|nr:uncharacterized protein LOC103867440 isoform X2 [Brassica rapa]
MGYLWALNIFTLSLLFQPPKFKFARLSLSLSLSLSLGLDSLAMALSVAFKERLDQMEFTRNQRLHLLQAEKELQVEKSQILATKHASIQSIERKCLMIDQKIAAQNLKITLLRSTIQDLDSKYHCSVQQLRTLKSEVEELRGVRPREGQLTSTINLNTHAKRRAVQIREPVRPSTFVWSK